MFFRFVSLHLADNVGWIYQATRLPLGLILQ